MGAMSGLEKLFVNRSNERTSKGAFELISGALNLPADSSLLELGAGRGALSHLLFERYKPKRIAVTDYDPLQVSEAEHYFQKKLERIPESVELRVADALNLPFEDESFDAVFAMHVLHHVESHEWHFKRLPRALDEIRRVLKRDGILAFEEIFKKNEITGHLEQSGFRETFARGTWIWSISKFFVYQKTMGHETRGSEPHPISMAHSGRF